MRHIKTSQSYESTAPLSQAVVHEGRVFASGLTAVDPATGTLVTGGIEEQTDQIFHNLSAIFEASGTSLLNTLKMNLYLVDTDHVVGLNDRIEEWFDAPYPARTTVGVDLIREGALIEIDATAAIV